MIKHTVFILACAAALVACDKPQTIEGKKPDAKASEGAVDGKFTAAGWSKGDATSWETQLNTRTQQGQNEYARIVPTATAAVPKAAAAAPAASAPK